MSKILEQLKQAEALRQRVVAERKQLEEEANAALAAREREELPRRAAAARVEAEEADAPAPRQDWRAVAGVAAVIAVALIAVFWSGAFAPQRETARESKAVPVANPVAQAETRGGSLQLKLDQDVDAFASRVREKERR